MKKYFLLTIFIISTIKIYSQDITYGPHPRAKSCQTENICPRKTIFVEGNIRFKNLFGLISLNFDHTIVCRTNYLVSYAIGVDAYSFRHSRATGIPLTINLMLGGGPLMFELGLGVNPLYFYKNYNPSTSSYNPNELTLALKGNVGVRFEQLHSIFIRAGYTPFYTLFNNSNIPILSSSKFNNMFGISLGYTF